MYYNRIYNFIEELNSENIEKNKLQLKKYIIELILSIKDYNDDIKFEELESMLNIILFREEIYSQVEDELKENKSKFGLLTDEFIKVYRQFINNIVENSYIEDAITITRNVIKAIGCRYRAIYLIKINDGFNNDNYLNSKEFLDALINEVYKHLKQDIKEISKEYFNVLGLVEFIKSELEEDIESIGNILMHELKNKSLDNFHKEEHIPEYKHIFTSEYINELKRRKYEWNILSSKLKESYYGDILYNNL